MRLKPTLSVRALGTKRFAVGILAGILFAFGFHAAGVAVGRGTIAVNAVGAEGRIWWNQGYNDQLRAAGQPPRYPPPTVTDPDPVPVPEWAEPLWAGLAAALGQALTLTAWFVRPTRPGVRERRARRRGWLGATAGAMWIGLVPHLLVKFWIVYAFVLLPVNISATFYGEPFFPDPLEPFGPAFAVALVATLALEPWRGVRLGYRSGWWPAFGLLAVSICAAALYGLGRALLPGAV